MAEGPLSRLMAWARRRGQCALVVHGAVADHDVATLTSELRRLGLGVRTDARDARHADLLIVIGRVSHKLAPFLVRAHAAMPRPCGVLHLDLDPPAAVGPATYAEVATLAEILPVDVVVRGGVPSETDLERALQALSSRVAARASRVAVAAPDGAGKAL